ncbi:MAG TPA: Zn-dependent protease with chaperone function [Cyanobacteria bacterium UBA11370]|nr:Zn-dependent protease with chaperone function [Cyanobacteria bacterium UBA11370]
MTSVPNPSLDTGLAALKQGNYSMAIAHLEGVREIELDESLVSRAAMGLVTAYRRIGDGAKAIALCQELTQDSNATVKEWATTTLPELTAEFPTPTHPSPSDSTGFVPLDSTPPSDSTGFVPLEPTSMRGVGSGEWGVGLEATPTQPQTTPSTLKQRIANSAKRLLSNSPTQTSKFKTQNSPTPTQTSSQLPIPYSSPSTPSLFTPHPRFRNLGRAKTWSPLKPPPLTRLWLAEIGSAIALFWVLHFCVKFLMGTTNTILEKLPLLQPIQLFYRDPTPTIWILSALLLILCPWLIDGVLRQFYGLKPLSLTQLASRSPEAAQVLQRFCRQRRLPIPTLGILSTNAPVAMSYGNLPRTARIIISEGVFEQLADDEIATIYAAELGHIIHWDFILMSVGTLFIQIPYIIYWQVAQWGEQLQDFIERKLPAYRGFLPQIVRGVMSAIAALNYGSYWVLRLPLLWLSRARIYYSDRIAVEATGNPNGFARALLKMGLGMTKGIQTSGQVSGFLESFDVLFPVGYQQAISLSTCSPQASFERILHWDCTNPYRDWLIITASHPLMGDRLHLCARYAHHWTLGTELDLPPLSPPIRDNKARLLKLQNSYQALPLLHSALLAGLILGIVLRTSLWLIGIISDSLNIWQLIWLHNANPFLDACILSAFSLSVLIWINGYFPDIKPPKILTEPNLGELWANPDTLPPDSLPVQLSGKLLGRSGLLNGLGQDLILQTSTGLVKLHFLSYLGPVGNLLPLSIHPSDLVGKEVTVMGWFRRGVTPWIDVELLRTPEGKVSRANYPIWVTILAIAAAVWGAYLIWQA